MLAIHGGIQDLQSTSVALWQGKGPFHWAAHQVLGMALKKMQSENSFGACNTHTCRYQTEIGAGGICISLVDGSLMLNGQFLIENKQLIRVVLCLQVTLEGSCR
jgi:hypothetical protein